METESERESAAVASMAAEPMRRPRVRLKKNIHSFTRMERKRMTTAIPGEGGDFRGKDLLQGGLANLHPHQKDGQGHHQTGEVLHPSVAEGVLLVGVLPASRNPTKVMTEEAASDRLLKASATTAMEPVARPERSLPRKSRALSAMPTPPDTEPHR